MNRCARTLMLILLSGCFGAAALAEIDDDACGGGTPPPLVHFDSVTAGRSVSPAALYAASLVDAQQVEHVIRDDLLTYLGANKWADGGPEHAPCRLAIEALLQSYGYAPTEEPFTLFGLSGINVIAEKIGTVRPNDIYVIAGHYDSVHNPGADDNSSGIEAVLEIARIVAAWPSDATIRFIAFDVEESGKVGSKAYVAAHINDNFLGMISIDMAAFRSSPHNHVPVYGRTTSNDVKVAFAAALTSCAGMDVWVGPLWDGSDHAPFEAAGFEAALELEWDYVRNPYYHRPPDSTGTPGYIDYDYAVAVTRGLMGWLLDAAGVNPPHPLGDGNCDFVVDLQDLPAITLAITNEPEYMADYPGCDPLNADCNHDGLLTPDDIDAFMQLLSGSCQTPGVAADLLPDDGSTGDQFGTAVALEDQRALVGAPFRHSPDPDAGAAYILERDPNSGTWLETALLAPTSDAGDHFGSSVALSGDYAAIGAPQRQGAGAAYIFTHSADAWTPSDPFVGSDTQAGDNFAQALALEGTTLVIGAPFNDTAGQHSGAVYVFELAGGIWNETAVLHAPDAQDNAAFGTSVALGGDTLAVGAPDVDGPPSQSGAVYVFDRAAGQWNWTCKLVAPDASVNENFGVAVALDGDVLAAAKCFTTPWGAVSGAAYAFTRDSAGWHAGPKLTDWSHALGAAVAVHGDRVFVGRRGGDLPTLSGTVTVFDRADDLWHCLAVVRPTDAAANDGFGSALAVSGDRLLAGAPHHTAAMPNSGQAYIVNAVAGEQPWISAQPQGDHTHVHHAATFSITAGPTNIMYQWKKDGVPLPENGHYTGTNSPTLTISDVDTPDVGGYSAGLTNACGYVASAVAELAVVANGDMNCDGVLNFDDINPFVLALSDPASYQQAFPQCNMFNGDVNGDGDVNFDDINPFVGLLSSVK